MSRINTNINSLIAQRVLGQQNSRLTKSLERLSTGLAINRGADNPAGLIASEKLRVEKVSLAAALDNAERADQIVNIAEGGLQEISSLLIEVQSLVEQTASDAGLSQAEKDANQLQIDSILQTIDRIAATTSFQGTKLLNGTFDFQVAAVDADVVDFEINGAKIAANSTQDVTALITQSAQHAGLFLGLVAAVVNTGADDADSRLTFELAGAKGSREFSFASGTAIADVISTINQFKSVTGVSAVIEGANSVNLKSTEFGSAQFVSVELKDVTAGQIGNVDQQNATNEAVAAGAATNFTALTAAERDEGQDIGAIINGVTARGRGLTASINTDVLGISVTLTSGANGAQGLGSISVLTISGGGASFNLGPTIDLNNQVRLGIKNVVARNLGSTLVGGFLDDIGAGKSFDLNNSDLETTQKIVAKAIDQVATL
ncbi:MAG: flagellin, partial [Phycisphaeraceae bacterium]